MDANHSKILEKRLGYTFSDPQLLIRALTHPSKDGVENYERLEFLGDAVIELFVSSYLFRHYPDVPEGELTRKRSVIVRTNGLAMIARDLDLGACLILGHGEEVNCGRTKPTILENALEAVAGAVYLDGGHTAAWEVLSRLFAARCREVMASSAPSADAKSQLQEKVQGTFKKEIRYTVVRSEGPPHDPTFYVELQVGGRRICRASGSSKKEAEQGAAQKALLHFEEYFQEDLHDTV